MGVDAQPPVLTGDQYRLLLGAGGAFAVLALLGLVNIFRRPRNAPPGGCYLFAHWRGSEGLSVKTQDQSGQRSWLSAGNGCDCVAQNTALTAQSNAKQQTRSVQPRHWRIMPPILSARTSF